MDSDLNPTFVIGVGQAGIGVLEALTDVVAEEGGEDRFELLAIDTNQRELSQVPEAVSALLLTTSAEIFQSDRDQYPYLHENIAHSEVGATRQRTLGRYALDNQTVPTFSDCFNEMYERIRNHYSINEYSILQGGSLNLYLINSLGGGTGSGTFPLVSVMLKKITATMERRNNIDVYTAAVGITPRLDVSVAVQSPAADPRYYANAYAALCDLTKLIGTSDGETLRLPVYSQQLQSTSEHAMTDAMDPSGFEIEAPPFDDYFLFGVNEERMGGREKGRRPVFESYRTQVDFTIAESLYTLSLVHDENRVGAFPQPTSILGSLSEAEVRIPVDRVNEYVRRHEEVEQLRERRAELVSALSLLREDDAEEVLLDESATSLLDEYVGGKDEVFKADPSDLRYVLHEVEQQADDDVTAVPPVVIKLSSRVKAARETASDAWAETVADLWNKHNEEADRLGGTATTGSRKAAQLERYFEERIRTLEDRLTELDSGFLDSIPFIEGEHEAAKRRLETLREDQERLATARERRDRVRMLRDALHEQRREINDRLEDRRVNIERRIEDLEAEIQSRKQMLTEPRASQRVVSVPLTNLGDLAPPDLEELSSIADFVEAGVINSEDLMTALDYAMQSALAWENSVMQFEYSDQIEPTDKSTVLLMLYAEANESHVDFGINVGASHIRRSSDSLPSIDNSHVVKFVSYVNQGPVEGLKLYQALDQTAADSMLNEMLDDGDYRHSFAYPEWYGRNIREAFGGAPVVELPRPPELAVEDIEGLGENETKEEPMDRFGVEELAAYLWDGANWSAYRGEAAFEGWREALTGMGATRREVEAAISDKVAQEWMAGMRDWDEVLDTFAKRLYEDAAIDVQWV